MGYVFKRTRGLSMGYKGPAGTTNWVGAMTAEVSPLAVGMTFDHENDRRALLVWMEAYMDEAGVIHYGYEVECKLADAPGFESYSDSDRFNFAGGAPFLHGGQIKAQILHYRGQRPKDSGRNDSRRDQYTFRTGLYLREYDEATGQLR